MLKFIHIKDFAIINHLVLDLPAGMTVITGETGSGKSIVIDALDVALGDRADSKMIRQGAKKCEISIGIDITHIPEAKAWLLENDFLQEDDCLLRRVTSSEGRSRNFINGHCVTLNQLRELGNLLVHVHGQHQHYALQKKEEQRRLLDHYADHDTLLKAVKESYDQWQENQAAIFLHEQKENQDATMTLLRYQVEELDNLTLEEDELDKLHTEQRNLANAEDLIASCQKVLGFLSEDAQNNCLQALNYAISALEDAKALDYRLNNASELISNAIIHTQEAQNEVKDYVNQLECNPARLQQVENRLSLIHSMARKHKINPENLYEHQKTLQEKLFAFENSENILAALKQSEAKLLQNYLQHSKKLSLSRQEKAKQLSQLVTQGMQHLGMPGGKFEVKFDEPSIQPSIFGSDKLEFFVSANPGYPVQALAKVVSGGELSRISLAIQLITAKKEATPTLIFDEVDVGIGGATAEMVGKLLRRLGKTAQVLCITHLPQVAAQGNQHLKISKFVENNITHSKVSFLSQNERIEELARMLGGMKITSHTRLHAEEMLQNQEDNQDLTIPL